MWTNVRISFIGSGVMAEAMIRGLLNKQVVKPEQIVASGPRAQRGEELRERYGIQVTTDNCAAAEGAGVVVLAVKPQMLPHVLRGLKGHVSPDALILSIIAGAPIHTIESGLANSNVIRAMPNTPAQIGEGMTVWTSAPSVTPTQLEQGRAILAALGEEVQVEDEDYLDMATALSGTGPAYVFLFMEALIDAGVHLGFPRYLAEKLVLQTVKGSVDYAAHTSQHVARLRNQVTSPGGTSAEALYYLEKAGFRTALSRALWAAYQRSTQLGRGKKRGLPQED